MKAPPSQVLVLSTADSTVFLGPPGAWGMSELGSLGVLDKPVETLNDRQALDTLEGLKRDDWQVAKLRNYLAGPAITGYGSVTVRTTRHDTTHLFGSLRTHLRSHRLRAVVIRNHVRPVAPSVAQRGVAGPGPLPGAASAGPQVSRPGLPGRPGTLPRGGSLPAVRPPANLAGWSTRDRLMALLHDTLPLLGPGLRAHIAAMTSTEAVAHLLAGMALMAGLQAVPVVGEAADAVFLGMAYAYAGWDGLRAVVQLVQAVRAALGARSEAEIAHAAPGAADALITLGGAFLDAVALRMAKRNTSGGGTAAAEEEVEQVVNTKRGQGVGRSNAIGSDAPDSSQSEVSARLRYMGSTPSKYSRTGREVVQRMQSEGSIVGDGPLLRGNPNNLKVVGQDGQLYNIDQNVDMAHTTDAVTWWNQTGRFTGAKSPEVRSFMLDPDNYALEPGSLNRSSGAKLGTTYQPPEPPTFDDLE